MAAVSSSRVVAKQALSMVLVLALIVPTVITEFASAKAVHALAGDFNGDGVATPGLFVDGLFILSGANDRGDTIRFHYGRPDDLPVVGDWTGNGVDTVGVVRRGRHWHLRFSNSAGVADRSFTYGGWLGRDRPVVGDWIGKGYDLPGIVRGSTWHLRNALAGGDADITFTYGRVGRGDHPVMADWNGNGVDTAGIVRDGRWHVKNTHSGGSADWTFFYGRADDVPVVGSWDGRRRDTPGVVRGTTWLLKNSLSAGPADIVLEFPDSTGDEEVEALRRPEESPSRGAPSKPAPEPEPELEPAPEPEPSPETDDVQGELTRTSIGSPEPAGNLSFNSGAYTLKGGGADIWKASDSFEFAHQTMEGDGKVVVRVNSQTPTHEWAKAGLMIRSDLTPGAQHVSVFQTPGHGAVLQYRRSPNTNAVHHEDGVAASAPTWLQLERKGDTFTARSSNDGLKWTLIGSVSVAMATVAFVGLAVTSHNDGTPSTAEFDSLEQRALESAEDSSTAPVEAPAEPSPIPDVSAGLLHTPEEVAVWRERSIAGPYRVSGDVSANSPGDWTRIREGADRFVANPESSRWSGPSQGNLSTCVQKWDDRPPVDGPSNLRDAAFVALVTGAEAEREAVKRELLSQASVPGTDFSNASRWCAGVLYDISPSFQISHWVTKLLLAYDYLGRDTFSSSEQEALDRWFFSAARFIQTDLDLSLESIHVDRVNQELSRSMTSSPSCTRPHYLDGPESCKIHRIYNNRRAAQARLVGLVGVFLEEESLKRSASLFVEEYVKYGVFPEGFVSDFQRWSARNPQLGWAYGAATVAPVLVIADAFARAGDSSLYDYSTSVGALGTEGGPKDLLFAARSFGRHVDGTYRRYGTDDPNRRGDPDYLIDGRFESGNWYGVHDISFALANVYYRDRYLRGAYTRSGPGMGGYPSRASNGPNVIWTGEGGILPGVLFMYGQMEDAVWPYG